MSLKSLNTTSTEMTKKAKKELEALVNFGEAAQITVNAKYPKRSTVTINGETEQILESYTLYSKAGDVYFHLYDAKQNIIKSNFSVSGLSETENGELTIFLEPKSSVDNLGKFHLYILHGEIYKWSPDEPAEDAADFVSIYIRTKHYHFIIYFDYTVEKIPHITIYPTADNKIGKIFKLSLDRQIKLAINKELTIEKLKKLLDSMQNGGV